MIRNHRYTGILMYGDDDFLYEGNALIHIAMRQKGIPHEFRMRNGEHNWAYWRVSLPEVLEFISRGFHRPW